MVAAEKPGFVVGVHHSLREWFTPVGRHNKQKEWAVAKSLPSTVSIVVMPRFAQEGEEVQGDEGSGFAVATIPGRGKEPGEIIFATNRHVIARALDGSFALQVITSGAEGGRSREELKKTFNNVEVAYVDPTHDLAFLRISLAEHPEVKMSALKLGHSLLVDVPDTLLNIGAPLGEQDTTTEIHLSQGRMTKICDGENCDMYRQISQGNPGVSGGAVIDPVYAGRFGQPQVVGMSTIGIEGNPTLAYMLPVEVIADGLAVVLKGQNMRRSAPTPVELPAAA